MVEAILILAAVTATAGEGSGNHVRATTPRIATLLERGVQRSATFRRLVATLDASDVIVYLEPKQQRQALVGFLSHQIVTTGATRYLRVSIETQGPESRLLSIIGHELQHAVEVAQAPDARDPESVARAFARMTIQFGCGARDCYETRAAKAVERAVLKEIKAWRPATDPPRFPRNSHGFPVISARHAQAFCGHYGPEWRTV